MKKTIAIAITAYCLTLIACLAQGSIETLGFLRYDTSTHSKDWGAGVDLGVKFNQWVKGHLRLVSYETDNWGGGAIDEGSALVEGALFRSANRKLTLSAIGGVDRLFASSDWGLSAGGRVSYALTKRTYLLLESRARIAEHRDAEVVSVGGIGFSF